jgi:hypothetical protein
LFAFDGEPGCACLFVDVGLEFALDGLAIAGGGFVLGEPFDLFGKLIRVGLGVDGQLQFGFRSLEIGFENGFFLFEFGVEKKIDHQKPREE